MGFNNKGVWYRVQGTGYRVQGPRPRAPPAKRGISYLELIVTNVFKRLSVNHPHKVLIPKRNTSVLSRVLCTVPAPLNFSKKRTKRIQMGRRAPYFLSRVPCAINLIPLIVFVCTLYFKPYFYACKPDLYLLL